MSLTQSAPVVFIQYLAGLAIIDGIHSYDPGYQDLPVKLKWPNDIYALDPNAVPGTDGRSGYVKIGGILVNSSYAGGDYTLVAGIGMNVSNAAPTTSLNALVQAHNTKAANRGKAALTPFTMEKLLPRILTCFESLYAHFRRNGWSRELEDKYYRYTATRS